MLAVGRRALLVDVGSLEAAQSAYRWIRSLVDSGETPEVPRDVVPAAATVLIDGIEDLPWWRQQLLAGWPGGQGGTAETPDGPAGREVTIPVRYDGPDLDVVGRAWGCSGREVVHRHGRTSFTVAFGGFAPGFFYCTSGGALPETPRRDDPRTSVPAGSVALAGEYCGVYPTAMPGGWQLIGSTDEVLFDPDRDEPALLQIGDHLRFEWVS